MYPVYKKRERELPLECSTLNYSAPYLINLPNKSDRLKTVSSTLCAQKAVLGATEKSRTMHCTIAIHLYLVESVLFKLL